MLKSISVAIRGIAMGMAETIPGVSGGTIAFITGIYERLINSIKSFSMDLVPEFKKNGISGVWKTIDGGFIVQLGIGMIFGIVIGLFGLSFLLENYPPVVWAFFLGLVIASIFYLASKVEKWNMPSLLFLLLAAVIAYGITLIPMGAVNDNLLFIFFCGAIAISAMILPGVSGSFLLLIMGMYQFILHDTLKTGVFENQDPQAVIIMVVFGVGCIVGLMSFSRVLSWSFKYHENNTMAALTGFIVGSVYKLWPWRIPETGYNETDQWIEYPSTEVFDKIVTELYVSPVSYVELSGYSSHVLASILALLLGISIVYFLARNEKKN